MKKIIEIAKRLEAEIEREERKLGPDSDLIQRSVRRHLGMAKMHLKLMRSDINEAGFYVNRAAVLRQSMKELSKQLKRK